MANKRRVTVLLPLGGAPEANAEAISEVVRLVTEAWGLEAAWEQDAEVMLERMERDQERGFQDA